MNHKIDSYINALFSDVPRTKKAQELIDELLSNMRDRYEDYLREGKSEAQAYSLTVASSILPQQECPQHRRRCCAVYPGRRSGGVQRAVGPGASANHVSSGPVDFGCHCHGADCIQPYVHSRGVQGSG